VYPIDAVENFSRERNRVAGELQSLQLQFVSLGEACTNAGAREYLLHGCGRRVLVLKRALANVFEFFPVDRKTKLSQKEVADTQINVHAFMMNLFGFFENCAWALWHWHDLSAKIKHRRDVGLFNPKFARFLPAPLRTEIERPEMQQWHAEYLKDYRDALAHRIPLYLPPSQITPEAAERYRALDREKIMRLKAMDIEGFERAEREQAALEGPCFVILHSASESEGSRPLYLHPQLLTDALTLVEFAKVFLEHCEPKSGPS
jgi:hypothetical protein